MKYHYYRRWYCYSFFQLVLIAAIETKILKTNLHFIRNIITVDLMAIIMIIATAAAAVIAIIVAAVVKLITIAITLVAWMTGSFTAIAATKELHYSFKYID